MFEAIPQPYQVVPSINSRSRKSSDFWDISEGQLIGLVKFWCRKQLSPSRFQNLSKKLSKIRNRFLSFTSPFLILDKTENQHVIPNAG